LNKYIKHLFLVLIIFQTALSSVGAELNMEIGNALFTDGFNLFGAEFGRSILYYKWNGIGDPLDQNNHLVIEALGKDKKSALMPLVRDKAFWGNSSYTKERPNWLQRKRIVERAYDLMCLVSTGLSSGMGYQEAARIFCMANLMIEGECISLSNVAR